MFSLSATDWLIYHTQRRQIFSIAPGSVTAEGKITWIIGDTVGREIICGAWVPTYQMQSIASTQLFWSTSSSACLRSSSLLPLLLKSCSLFSYVKPEKKQHSCSPAGCWNKKTNPPQITLYLLYMAAYLHSFCIFLCWFLCFSCSLLQSTSRSKCWRDIRSQTQPITMTVRSQRHGMNSCFR